MLTGDLSQSRFDSKKMKKNLDKVENYIIFDRKEKKDIRKETKEAIARTE
jgi:hypothetical protein